VRGLAERLFSGALQRVGPSFWRESEGEYLAAGTRDAEYRRRPTAAYYQDLGRPLPAPCDPQGPKATGLELGIGRASGTQVELWFQVSGAAERYGFLCLWRDWRRPLANLLEGGGYTFRSPVVFANVEGYRGRSAVKRLERYADNRCDPENCFRLSRVFAPGDTLDEVQDAAIRLMILFDALIGYAKRRRDQDRLLRYAALM